MFVLYLNPVLLLAHRCNRQKEGIGEAASSHLQQTEGRTGAVASLFRTHSIQAIHCSVLATSTAQLELLG